MPVSAEAGSSAEVQRAAPPFAAGMAAIMVGLKLAIHLLTSLHHYGYFRDELYFLDCARHLDWGYVDTAPLIAVYAKLALLMGGSLPALRILPALAGAALIALSMFIAWQLGGGRFAQALTGVCALVSPAILGVDVILSMNAFEPLFWMGAISVLIAILKTGNSRLWLWFGVLAGLGLENKHSMLFFGFAVLAGVLLTPLRRELLKPWIWLGGLIALLIFLPNVIWQVRHHYPTLEDLENVRHSGKNVVLGVKAFVGAQILTLHPILLPVWIAGLVSFFRHRKTRMLGWIFVVFFVIMYAAKAKDYYLFPIYPMLLAGGAVAVERWFVKRPALDRRVSLKAAMIATIALLAIPIDLLVVPALSPAKYVAYTQALHLAPPKTEVAHEGPLPQLFGDQFGWEELVKQVADAYWSLPPEERTRTGIFATNYGEAGALHLFGPRYGLPWAISTHQNHFFWGPPDFKGDNLIVLQWGPRRLDRYCQSGEVLAEHYHPYGMEEENGPIYFCRGLKQPLSEVWPRWKLWN
jgi:hypothetical protein